ncbi:hypothetical protein JNUCC64_26060 [Streptomyces sp. JNUCC 64]
MSSNPDGPGSTDGGTAPLDGPEPREEPSRRTRGTSGRRSPVALAAVAAVVLAGGGGTYLAVAASGGGSGGSPGRNGAPPPLSLDGHAATLPAGSGTTREGVEGPGIAPGEPDPGGTRYEARGRLPEGPGKASVYRPDPPVARAGVNALAKALGVAGEPVLKGGTWRVGAADGAGPSLRVAEDGAGTWTFARYATEPDACEAVTRCATREEPRAPRVPGAPTKGAPIGEAAAKAAAAPVLKALGQDAAKLDARQVMGSERVVNAAPEVGGLPTFGWSTGLRIGLTGEVTGGSGQLAALARGASYPVIGAEEALELLNGAGNGPVEVSGCATAVPHRDEISVPCGGEPTAVAPAKESLAVTGAVFGLSSQLSGGEPVLVPSWLFEVSPGGSGAPYTVTYPAVSPAHLTGPGDSSAAPAPASPSAPAGRPEPAPTPPSEGGRTTREDTEVAWYETRGDDLVLHYVGGVCGTYTASAEEKGDRVTARITWSGDPEQACVALAEYAERTVRLDAPLGARKVVDAKGEPIPDRAPEGWPGTEGGVVR